MKSVPIRNRIRSVVAGYIRRRMIAAKDRFRQQAETSCDQRQLQTLKELLQLNFGSQFSEDHALSPDLSVDQFRQRLPVSDYETFRPYVDRMTEGQHRALLGRDNRLLMFAVTSGTTSRSKLIPVTERFVSDYRRGWQHWGMGLYQNHPELTLLRLVQISSAFDRDHVADGTPCGNISGLAAARQRFLVRKLYSVPAAVSRVSNSTAKRLVISAFALSDPFVGMFITANPSTLLQLHETANTHVEVLLRAIADGSLAALPNVDDDVLRSSLRLKANPGRARQLEQLVNQHGSFVPSLCWPHLSCLGVWTGGSAGAYLPKAREVFGNLPVRDHGLHASEGRMTIPFDDGTSDGLLDIESHFFEFIPVAESQSKSPTVLMAHELQPDHDYEILLTTSSGFYRYNMYDVVRCTGFHGTTPILRFLHKSAHMSSITGEKITESQVVDAVQASATQLQITLRQFTLTPAWGDPPGYELFIRPTTEVGDPQVSEFSQTVDQTLCRLNCEYADKRESGRLAPIRAIAVPVEDWIQFEATRLEQSGGSPEQYKHPCLLPDSTFTGTFRKVTGRTVDKSLTADTA